MNDDDLLCVKDDDLICAKDDDLPSVKDDDLPQSLPLTDLEQAATSRASQSVLLAPCVRVLSLGRFDEN